ncbi:MAG: hypothetical protein HY343_03450, partial [Lentisphaerae bacterium]|nr:hypothetical protein [Lentisphaerota bacterium]
MIHKILAGLIALGLLGVAGSSHAATRTWIVGAGDWFQAANWGGTVPQAGDDVVITNAAANVALTNFTPALASLTINKTLTFSNWYTYVQAVTVTIQNGGTMTCAGIATTNIMTNRVYLSCSNLTIDVGGSINVNSKGYNGVRGALEGTGPGRGIYSGGGAGYGGWGGYSGPSYGSSNAPVDPGSGGSGTPWSSGGSGGGAVRIVATGTVTVNGAISALGGNTGTRGGGGSGGSIYITCNVIAGSNGVVSANGGSSSAYDYPGYGGGGGRISVNYSPAAQDTIPLPTIQFTAGGGAHGATYETWGSGGDLGTLYFPDNRFFTSPMTHKGQWLVPGLTAISLDSLVLSNAWIRLNSSGFSLTITNDLTLIGAGGYQYLAGRLDTLNAIVNVGGSLVMTNAAWLTFSGASTNILGATVGGNLMFYSGRLLLYSGVTNSGTPDYGALIGVTGLLYTGSGAWIYPYSNPTNGGSPLFRMSNLVVAAGGGFSANGLGYLGGNVSPGWGPGGGQQSYGGGGYGGFGMSVTATNGIVYGSAEMPLQAGSGGGSSSSGYLGGNGGGAIRIEATGDVTVNGTLTANGGAGTAYSSCGSGGGIYILCNTIQGAGLVSAASGNEGSSYAQGGGGGRIAVIYNTTAQSALFMPALKFWAPGGFAFGKWGIGEAGTLYFPDNYFLTNVFRHAGQWMVTNFAGWSVENLTITNGLLTFPTTAFQLTVTNDCSIVGTYALLNRLKLSDGVVRVGGNLTLNNGGLMMIAGTNFGSDLRCGGDLILTNTSQLYVYSAATNDPATNYGAWVSVTGAMVVGTGSWVYPYCERYQGGAPLFTMRDLLVESNAGFNANSRGYYPTNTSPAGWGSGPGTAYWRGGAGHGALGGHGGGSYYPGIEYGSSNMPVDAGSSGGHDAGEYGGIGGGVVRIRATGTIENHGTLVASGGNTGTGYSGGGAGGSIFLISRTFVGDVNSVMRAVGGQSGSSY